MKKYAFTTAVIILLSATGCYSPISGRVIDAETNQPIEGAVVLVEWTKTIGYGLTYTESYKVAEALSGKDGQLELPGCNSAFVNAPDVTVYKKGYVAWSSRWMFPGYRNRTDFRWGDYVFKLDRFKEGYSYIDHTSFIHSSINLGFGDKKLIAESYYWEELEASKERDNRRSH